VEELPVDRRRSLALVFLLPLAHEHDVVRSGNPNAAVTRRLEQDDLGIVLVDLADGESSPSGSAVPLPRNRPR
jgi:hypothetical protein